MKIISLNILLKNYAAKGGWVRQMLTRLTKGGWVGEMLTMADQGGRGCLGNADNG